MTISSPALPGRVRDTIARYTMIGPGSRVLAAVSGGADSVALLEVLLELDVAVEVAHFDHQTRGGASRQDAEFVATLAAKHALEFHLESCPVAATAVAVGKSFEQHARDVRYAFLLRLARDRGCATIATGHQKDDQVETVLMRLLHGCAPQALAGIPPVRISGDVRIVRPLIECTRTEILAYLTESGVTYREDDSNADVTIPRNRIRHDILPLLERTLNPRVREAVLRIAEQQRVLNEFLARQEEEAIESCVLPGGAIDRATFALLDPAQMHRVALHVARVHGVRADAARVAALAQFVVSGGARRRFDLGNGVLLLNNREITEPVKTAPSPSATELPLPVPGEACFLDRRFTAKLTSNPPEPDVRTFCTPQRQVFDADKAAGALSIRTRRDGDRFRPLGMTGTRKLSDYFIDRGVPAPRRDCIPLVVAGGQILWVVGHSPSAAAAVSARTRHFLIIEVHGAEPETFDEIE